MVQFAEHGCQGGDPGGCAMLGRLYERGYGVAPDPARSAAYYEQACAGGHRQSCLFLASRAEGPAAVLAFERACNAGSGLGCVTAGQRHLVGAGVQPSVEQAGLYFERGCAIGNPTSCVIGAETFSEGPSADLRRAAKIASDGCKQGIPGACKALGDVDELAELHTQAREAYRKACDLGQQSACGAGQTPRIAPQMRDPGD